MLLVGSYDRCLSRIARAGIFISILFAAACGDDADDTFALGPHLPVIPAPTGEPQSVYAGEITSDRASELLKGPAATGRVGDYFIRNGKTAFVVSAATRVIGVIPQGGNLIDAVTLDGGKQTADDHFGELALIYLVGRTCEHSRVEVVADGSGGGVAAIRAIGKSGNNDFINVKGIGAFPIADEVDPSVPDAVDCATTYILEPGAEHIQVYHTLLNRGANEVTGPFGTMVDTGGNVEYWGNLRGFERLGIEALPTLANPTPIDYPAYQGPGIAYGIIPRHETPTTHTAVLIAGVSIMLVGNDALLDILDRERYPLKLAPNAARTQRYDFAVGRDTNALDRQFRSGLGENLTAVAGKVTWSNGKPALGARVGVFRDANADGKLDATDPVESFIDVAADGTYAGQIAGGNHLLAAYVKNLGMSAVVAAGSAVNLTIPAPIKIDYTVTDDETNMPSPAKLIAVGSHPAQPDMRVFETYDRVGGVVDFVHAIRGSSTDMGDGADPALYLPSGGSYRVYATRGTEYSFDSAAVSGNADQTVALRLRRVVPTEGYLATEWHVHQVGSPDSPVLSDERVRSAAAAGMELFAVTDHDFVSDLQPLVEAMGLKDVMRVMPGIEVTPFVYGHYQAWPMSPLPDDPSNGAIDWARGANGLALTPKEIYAAMRARGAKMLQINHPRGSGFGQMQAALDRANLKYDYSARMMFGDYANGAVPNEWLRLPEETLWDPGFNGLEVWNGFTQVDSDMDGVRENQSMDRVLADWFNMLSMGFYVSPAGSSDTHTANKDPMGMPRTMVRVSDDRPAMLASGAAVDDVLATQTRTTTSGTATPNDLVITNGPMIDVKVGGQPALGREVNGTSGLTAVVTMYAADWAEFDTLEVFANATPTSPVTNNKTALQPLKCWTARDRASLAASDPCKLAPLAPESMTVTLENVAGNVKRYRAVVTVTLDDADIVNRTGATGKDAWLVFRVRGDRAIFPVMADGAATGPLLDVALRGNRNEMATAFHGKGILAAAFTTPVFVDFDGGGYRAPFAP